MIFKSRKDLNFQLTILGLIGLFLGIIFMGFFKEGNHFEGFYWFNILLILIIGFFLWMYFGTRYELTPTELKYRSGPVDGRIEIDKIREIIIGKTMWSGLKPATATKGLIIKYGKFYDEIYISPDSNSTFVNKILELNSKIKVITI